MIRIDSDYSEIDQELDRLERIANGGGVKMNAKLDQALEAARLQVILRVHVDTGSLKSSIKATSKRILDTWVGTVTAGGPSAGVNNPVKYAIYEKARGGDHDFFGNLHLLKNLWLDIIKEELRP